MIIDHHPMKGEPVAELMVVNPILFGIDDSHEISTSGVCHLLSQESEDGTDAIYSLGIGYNVDYDSTVRLEYELSEYDILDYSVISFGFQHNF